MAIMMFLVPCVLFVVSTVLANKDSFTQNQRTGTVTVSAILLVAFCIISIVAGK